MKRITMVAWTVLLVLASGCDPGLSRARFEQVRVGMDDRESVRKLLGKPTGDADEQWYYEDMKSHESALIHFDRRGRVSGKQWMDTVTDGWDDVNPRID